MQTLFTPAKSQSTANVRFPTAVIRIAWKRALSSGTLATVGTSLVGGLDVVVGAEGAAMPWDSYVYNDETPYVLGFSYDREIVEPQGGLAAATLDVTFDNTGKRYTPDYNVTVGTALIPNRPIIVDAGFIVGTNRTVPVFKGTSYGDVEPDYMNRTAKVRAADLITLLDQTTLAASVYLNQRSDQIILAVLNDAGIGASQHDLDVGLNDIPFAWFPSSMHALERIRKVCEAEEASFYQDERGKIRFETRLHYKSFPHTISQITLSKDDFVSMERVINTRIINRCVVEGLPREVDASNTTVWETPSEVEVEGNSSKTMWAHPTEPESSIPLLLHSIVNAAATTDYTAFAATGGGGADLTGDQTVTYTNFVDAVKIVLQNGNVAKAYYNKLQVRGKAARVQKAIRAVSEDATSISRYGVREYVINNDFVQTLSWADAIADDMVAKYKDPANRLVIKIPALPHLQLKDRVTITDPDLGTDSDYRVMRIMANFIPGSYTQDVVLRAIDSSETAT